MIDHEIIKSLQNANEVELFFFIEECGIFIHNINHDITQGKIEEKLFPVIENDIKKVSEAQNFAARELARFGINPNSVADHENGDYWKWYKFYSNWRDNLSVADWQVVKKRMESRQSFEEYLPKTSWREINLKK